MVAKSTRYLPTRPHDECCVWGRTQADDLLLSLCSFSLPLCDRNERMPPSENDAKCWINYRTVIDDEFSLDRFLMATQRSFFILVIRLQHKNSNQFTNWIQMSSGAATICSTNATASFELSTSCLDSLIIHHVKMWREKINRRKSK